MATFTFSSTTAKSSVKKIKLDKHPAVKEQNEYYSYTSEDGEEKIYNGIISKLDDNSYIGKIITIHKVELKYHPTVKSIDHQDEYFSYKDSFGNERVFVGEPKFDLEKNTYIGEVEEETLTDKVIKIYKEIN